MKWKIIRYPDCYRIYRDDELMTKTAFYVVARFYIWQHRNDHLAPKVVYEEEYQVEEEDPDVEV